MRIRNLLALALLAAACAAPVTAPVAGTDVTIATPTPEPTASPTASPAPTATPTMQVVVSQPSASPSPSAGAARTTLVLEASVPGKIAALIKASAGGAALVVADGLTGVALHEVKPAEVVFAASLYKLGVLLEAEYRIDRGRLRSTDRLTITKADLRDGEDYTPAGTTLTIEQALERMITLSDNATALALVRTFGTASIHQTLAREGIVGQYFTSRGSVTTARAVATFFGELARGALVSPSASARMLARLSRQRVVDRIPAALPAGVMLGNKTGNLGFVTHDAALFRGPANTPVVLVVLTWDSTEAVGSELIRDIAAAVYAGLSSP